MEKINNSLQKLAGTITQPQQHNTILNASVIHQQEKFLESLGVGKKLHELSIPTVKNILTAFAGLMGIPATNMPTEEVMIMTINAMIRNFGSMHEGEVKKAFEMAATGQLDVEGHYQSLSLKYICSVLNAFRIKVNQAVRFYENHRREELKQLDYKPEVDWSDTIEQIKKNPDIIFPASIFDWMVQKGMIHPTKEEKLEAMRYADMTYRQMLQTKISNGSAKSDDRRELEKMREGYGRKDAIYNKIANEAKKLLVKKYLSNA